MTTKRKIKYICEKCKNELESQRSSQINSHNEINKNNTKNITSNLVLAEGQNRCPKCQSDWDGGSILETFIKQREEGVKMWQGKSNEEIESHMKKNYSHPYRWGRKIGIEIQNGYDGVSYWQCPDCKTTFNRFTGIETILPLR